MSRNQQLRRLAVAWNEAWNRRDPKLLAAFFADGSTYYEPSLPRAAPGAKGVQTAARKTWREWPEVSFSEVSMTIDDPRVVIEWRGSAKHRSGKRVELQGVDVLEWKGEKLTAARVYYDVHQRNRAIGQ